MPKQVHPLGPMARLGKYASLALASAVIVFFPRVHRYNNASAL